MWRKGFTCCIYAALATFIMSGCAYVISPELRQQARTDIPFKQVLAQPDAYQGSVVIWGGIIVETNAGQQGSEIVILATPSTSYDRPADVEYAEGRFIAGTTTFLDPAVYAQGRKVTVAGTVTGKETRPLSKMQYTYPVVEIKQVHLWRNEPQYYYYHYYPPVYYGPWWGWPGPVYRRY